MFKPDKCPWNVPVPVKEANFVPLFEEHWHFNVQTDLSKIQAFGHNDSAICKEELLLADLQTNFGRHALGRLGSGRSGFFRGAYLKGVGHTPLAANWNNKDYLHNSGHLAASGAIREYVASEYLQSRGVGHSIVPCSGILVAPLHHSLKQYPSLLYGAEIASNAVPRTDLFLQALSVKGGFFVRASNILWLLHHLTPGHLQHSHSLSRFVELYAYGLCASHESAVTECHQLTPSHVAELQLGAIERAVDNFETWFIAGMWWWSFSNNFTLDGRFLDLETPSIAGGAILGFLMPDSGAMAGSGVIGTEVFIYLAQMKVFLQEICRVLAELPEWFHPLEREFAAALAAELSAKVLASHTLLGSREHAIDRVVTMIRAHVCNFSESTAQTVYEIAAKEYGLRFCPFPLLSEAESVAGSVPHFELEDLPPVLSQPGLRTFYRAFGFTPESLWHAPREEFRKGKAITELLNELDTCVDAEKLLIKLQDVPRVMGAIETVMA